MKKLFYLSLLIFVLAACKDEPDLGKKAKLDPDAMITIKGVAVNNGSSGQKAKVYGLTPLEVVEQALAIRWNTHYSDNEYSEEVRTIGRGFDVKQKDFTIPALKMWGIDIINQDGAYVKDFTHAFNVVFTDNNNDTIAYIPDEVINAVRPLIETAYLEEDYTEVYRLFDEAFTFIPF